MTNPGRRAHNRAAREAFQEARHNAKLAHLAEGQGRPSAQVMSARVQADRPPFERMGPLPGEVTEHLRAGVGARIKALRAEQGWTQAQLAERIGWSVETVGRLERGVHRPTHRQLAHVAKAFAGSDRLSRSRYLLLRDELVGLAMPHVRGRKYRGTPSIAADADAERAKLDRAAARLDRIVNDEP